VSADNVELTLIKIIKNYTNKEEDDINRAVSLREELGLSSFDIIALSAEIEESFSINIDNMDVLSDIETLGDLADLISANLPVRS
jgi:acyl carrier protein